MKRFFAERPMVAFFIVAVAATVVSAWIINPKEGPFAWLIHAGGSVDQLTLKVLAAAAILCVGASMTYIAWRLAPGGAGRLCPWYEHPESEDVKSCRPSIRAVSSIGHR